MILCLLIAQIPDWSSTVSTVGSTGAIIVWFMWRDAKREEREAVRTAARETKMDEVVKALNHLTRAMTLEVLSRPGIVQRAKSEAEELQSAISGSSR